MNDAKLWLSNLTLPQLRALASQNKIPDWKTATQIKLISTLSLFEDVEQPVVKYEV